jgi:hypothetical protein
MGPRRLAVPSFSMAWNSALATAKRSEARRRGRQAAGAPVVVRMWCVVLCGTGRWLPVGFVSAGNSSKSLSGGVPPCDDFHTGDCWWRGEARCGQRCDHVEQAVPAVDEESITGDQFNTDDGQLHVRYHETLCEVAAQPHVQAP